jgi:uncharacterized membrane protein
MVAVGLVAVISVAVWEPWQLAALVGWITAAAVYLLRTWPLILTSDGDQTQRLATIEDDSRAVSGLLVVVAATSSLVGAALALHKAGSTDAGTSAALTATAVITVVASWLVVNTDFTLRYAHLYHSDPSRGIDFPGVETPDFHDFAYLAFTVGMTYQVSDTGLLGPRFRRVLLAHAIVSYAFGTVIIAAVINIVAGIIN